MINKIISIGYRCSTDSFLSKFNLRFYSGPFSYLIVDFQTAITELSNDFSNYFIKIKKYNNYDNKVNYLNHWRFSKEYYVNEFYSDKINKNIYNLKRCLIWNHHKINDNSVKETFIRRISRIKNFIKNEKCILLYFDKIFYDNNIDEYINNILILCNTYYKLKHKILYVIPFVNEKYNNYNCKQYFNNNKLHVFLIKTTPIEKLLEETKKQKKTGTPLLDFDINDKNIDWDKLYNELHSFFYS